MWNTSTNKAHYEYDNSKLFCEIFDELEKQKLVIRDSTWKNDVCPSITADLGPELELTLFIDYDSDELKEDESNSLFYIKLGDYKETHEEYFYDKNQKEDVIKTFYELYMKHML